MKDLRPVGPVEVEDGNRVRDYFYSRQPGSTEGRPMVQYPTGDEMECPNNSSLRLLLWAGWLQGET